MRSKLTRGFQNKNNRFFYISEPGKPKSRYECKSDEKFITYEEDNRFSSSYPARFQTIPRLTDTVEWHLFVVIVVLYIMACREKYEEDNSQSQTSGTTNSEGGGIAPKKLPEKEQKKREILLEDLQNLIWALKFEPGPTHQKNDDNYGIIIFAPLLWILSSNYAWQEIQVSEGPKNQAMYEVLKAAIASINAGDLRILEEEKARYANQYDLVKTKLGGEKSISAGGYVWFANAAGTTKNQPGFLVDALLNRADEVLLAAETNQSQPAAKMG